MTDDLVQTRPACRQTPEAEGEAKTAEEEQPEERTQHHEQAEEEGNKLPGGLVVHDHVIDVVVGHVVAVVEVGVAGVFRRVYKSEVMHGEFDGDERPDVHELGEHDDEYGAMSGSDENRNWRVETNGICLIEILQSA